jgi:hypothetical protein
MDFIMGLQTLAKTISDNPYYHFIASCNSGFGKTQKMHIIKRWVRYTTVFTWEEKVQTR